MWLDTNNTGAGAQRRAERISFDMLVRFRRGVTRSTAMLKDLTPYGARIGGLDGMRIDESIHLMLPGLQPKLAFVAWTDGHSAGLEFERRLHPEVYETLVREFAVKHHRHGFPRAA